MEISTTIVKFRIDIDFPECEVDMVYKELASAGVITPVPSILCDSSQIPIDKSKLKATPLEASVNFCLQWLMGFVDRNEMCITTSKWEKDYSQKPIKATTESGLKYSTWPIVKTELENLGVDVESTYGLMMGTCHLICTCDIVKFSSDLVKECHQVVEQVFKNLIIYHDTK